MSGLTKELVASKSSDSCSSLGGTLTSSPSTVVVPQSDGSLRDFVFYKGSNNNVWWYRRTGGQNVHEDLGFALP